MTFDEVRAKYPQYEDMSDSELAEGLHAKYYSDLEFGDFANKIGYGGAITPGEQFVEGAEQLAKGTASGAGEFFENVAQVGGGHVADWSEDQAIRGAYATNPNMPTIPEYLDQKWEEAKAWWNGEEAPEQVVAEREAYVPEAGKTMDLWREEGKHSNMFAGGEFVGRLAPEIGATLVNPAYGAATTFVGANPEDKTITQMLTGEDVHEDQYTQRARSVIEDSAMGKIFSGVYKGGKQLFGGLDKTSTSTLHQAGKQIDDAIANGGDNAADLNKPLVINGKTYTTLDEDKNEVIVTIGDAKIFREKAAVAKLLSDNKAPVAIQNVAEQMNKEDIGKILGANPTVQKGISETINKLPFLSDVAKRVGFLEGAAGKGITKAVLEEVRKDADFHKHFENHIPEEYEIIKAYQSDMAKKLSEGDYDGAAQATKDWKQYIGHDDSNFNQKDKDLLYKQNRKYKTMIETLKQAKGEGAEVDKSTLAQAAGLYLGMDMFSGWTVAGATVAGLGVKQVGKQINKRRIDQINAALEGKLDPDSISLITEALYFSPRFAEGEEAEGMKFGG